MKIAIFSGTSEGRRLCEHLSIAGIAATACVATAYGAEVMPELDGISLREGRMDAAEMTEFLREFDTVADATHPYAVAVSDNLRHVCDALGVRYLRLVRPETQDSGVIRVASAREAAEYLAQHDGNALLTTGSKQLREFTTVADYQTRLFARVLPDADIIRAAHELGFSGRQLICMQGPFSHEMNAAMLRAVEAKFLVTKDTGAVGGLPEKLTAAREASVQVIMISRPVAETGCTLAELAELLSGAALNETAAPPPERAIDAPRFPLFVSLEGKRCVVIGAGRIASRRSEVLRRYGADVTVIAPEIRERIEGVTYCERSYAEGDLRDAFLVVAATNSRAVNEAVTCEATALGVHLSVADSPGDCTFWFPASIVSDMASAGVVSRAGNHKYAAAAARKIREVLE